MKLRLRTILVLCLIAAAIAAWALIDFLIVDEAEKLEHYLTHLVEEAPSKQASAYLNDVDLEGFGFRLKILRQALSFGPQDRDEFVSTAEKYVRWVLGSSLFGKNFDVQINDRIATFSFTVNFTKASSVAPVQRAVVVVSGAAAHDKTSWKITRLSLQPARNLMDHL